MARSKSSSELGQLATAMVTAAAYEDWDAAQSLLFEAAADDAEGISSSMFLAALLANALIALADVFDQPLETVISRWTNTVVSSLQAGATAGPVSHAAVPRAAVSGPDTAREFINLGQAVSLVSARRADVTSWVRAISDGSVPSWHDQNRGVLVRRADAEAWDPNSNPESRTQE